MDSGFRVLDTSLCQYNLDSGLQSLVGFRISWAVFRIPQAKFPHSVSRIPEGIISLIPVSGVRYMGRLLLVPFIIWRGIDNTWVKHVNKITVALLSKCLIVNAEIKLPLIHYQITCSTSESHLGLFRTTTACLTQRQLHRHDNVTTVLINYVHRKITVKSL